MLTARFRYAKGDVTQPQEHGHIIIAHVVNDQGYWGKGFTSVLNKRWPHIETEYRNYSPIQLGNVQFVYAENNTHQEIYVANMSAQHGIRKDRGGRPPIRYNALKQCLTVVGESAESLNYYKQQETGKHDVSLVTVCGPRFGAGLAGGDWEIIEPMVKRHIWQLGTNVTIYDPK